MYGPYISLDDKAALVTASFLESRLDYKRIFDDIRKIVVKPERDNTVKIYIGGQPILYGWVYAYTPQIFKIFVVTVLAVWMLLYLYFHDWRGALRPTISGVICAIWGLGFIRMIGFTLDPLVLVIPFLITARAVSHSVQMHDRYYEEYYRLRDKQKAILSAFAELFVPSFSGILADAFGVLVILLVPVLFLQKLAITASFWIAAIIVSELLLNPIVYYYLEPPHIEVIEQREHGIFKRIITRLVAAMLSSPGASSPSSATAAVIALCVFFWQGLKVGDPGSISPISVARRAIQSRDGGDSEASSARSSTSWSSRELNKQEALNDPKLYHVMDEYERYMSLDPSVGRTFSVADLLATNGAALREFQPKWAVLPTTKRQAGQLIGGLLAGASPLSTAYILTPRRDATQMTVYAKDRAGRKRRAAGDADAAVHRGSRAQGGECAIQAGRRNHRRAGRRQPGNRQERCAAQRARLRDHLHDHTVHLSIRRRGIVSAVPARARERAINAYMGAHDIGININTLPVVTVGVGFGIDYAIYVVSRIIEELALGHDINKATYLALITSGKAVVFTALTLVASVLFWYWSDIRFDAEMGMLLAVWMFVSMLGAMTILPVLIVTFRPKFIEKEKERVLASRRPDLAARQVSAA